MNSSLNSRFTEVQICAKSDTNGGIKQKHNVSTRILDQLSGLSDDALGPLSSLQMGNEIQDIHCRSVVVEMPVITTHGDRCMLARAGAGLRSRTIHTPMEGRPRQLSTP
ncbi:uncharacterized protein CPUR_02914 [Claviceps purpurea 20.1]|uniref:Uncharacterized protein n=1 Tax=Claviceps purpurea (strain 20.1) TaxID=1111077 RepID=M1W0C7_CLAP2|nr:uncharacterized protein CPUR_02914 [Claviceps purpurea 20.1]